MTIWITRTRPGADRTAARLAAAGLEALVDPVLEVRPLPASTDLSGFAGLAFSSPNGVDAFAAASRDRALPAFAVGDATAEALAHHGFSQIRNARGDVAALARRIGEEAGGRVLYLSPAEPSADLVSLVAPYGVAMEARPVYETVPVVPAQALRTAGLTAVLIHSARAGRVVSEVAGERLGDLDILALSEACAAPFSDGTVRSIRVAPFPDDASLVRLTVDTLSKAR